VCWGVGTAEATGALAPAMLKPRGESIFLPPQYFLTFLHAVPLSLYAYIQMIQLQLVLHVEYYETN